MKKIEYIIEAKKQNILLKFPEQKELTIFIFRIILEMLQEDFDVITQKSKRLKKVFDYVVSILEKAREQNVKKQYVIDLLDVFLDNDIIMYLSQKLEKNRAEYILAIKSARSELYCSQWSDTDSNHWQRAIKCFGL